MKIYKYNSTKGSRYVKEAFICIFAFACRLRLGAWHFAAENKAYVKSGVSSGTGLSASSPVATITEAFKVIAPEGGTASVPFANADALVFADEPLVSFGDADSSGDLSLLDVLRTLRYSVEGYAELDVAPANVNGDLAISALDVLGILKMIIN